MSGVHQQQSVELSQSLRAATVVLQRRLQLQRRVARLNTFNGYPLRCRRATTTYCSSRGGDCVHARARRSSPQLAAGEILVLQRRRARPIRMACRFEQIKWRAGQNFSSKSHWPQRAHAHVWLIATSHRRASARSSPINWIQLRSIGLEWRVQAPA